MIDAVSGNEVPPGSLPQEVRDDVDAKLSEGEYVLPADVVRYFGLDYIEKLVNKAKQGMEEFQAQGRIGGKTDEELPFSPEELQAHEAEMASGAPEMAVGGLVPAAGGVTDETNKGPVDPSTGLPWWMLQQQQQQKAMGAPQVQSSSSDNGPHKDPTGIAGSVDKWTAKDFTTYAKTQGNLANKAVETGISAMIPLGGLALQARYKYLNKAVPTQLEAMIASGKDSTGKPLTPQEVADLKAAKDSLAAKGDYTPGVKGVVAKTGFGQGLKNLFSGKKETEKTPTSKPTSKSTSTKSTTTQKSAPAKTTTKTTTKSQAAKAGFNSGGLITRR